MLDLRRALLMAINHMKKKTGNKNEDERREHLRCVCFHKVENVIRCEATDGKTAFSAPLCPQSLVNVPFHGDKLVLDFPDKNAVFNAGEVRLMHTEAEGLYWEFTGAVARHITTAPAIERSFIYPSLDYVRQGAAAAHTFSFALSRQVLRALINSMEKDDSVELILGMDALSPISAKIITGGQKLDTIDLLLMPVRDRNPIGKTRYRAPETI